MSTGEALVVRGAPSSPKGRSLHATAQHPAGTRLSTFSSPILALPTAAASPGTCHFCLRPDGPVLPCSACRSVAYCSKDCQRASWRLVHKAECPALKGVPEGRVLPTPVRALIQVAVRQDAWDAVLNLVGHEAEVRGDKVTWDDLRLQASMARRLLGRDPAWVAGGDVVEKYAIVLCKLLTNMFSVHDPDLSIDAVFLHARLAMANHSCVPNASAHVFGRTALLVSEQPIAEGEEVTISYTDTTLPLSHRKRDLAKYHFECQCSRCSQDLTLYQVCSEFPALVFNRFSVAPDFDALRSPPLPDKSLLAAGTTLQGTVYDQLSSLSSEELSLAHLRREYQICKPLAENGMWALLPTFLNDCLSYYIAADRPVEALLVCALSASRAHPYSHPSPSSPHRLKGALALCRALSNAQADRSVYVAHLGEVARRTGADADLDVDVLKDLDGVAAARMILGMIVHYLPVTQMEGWPLAARARQDLEAIRGLPWGSDDGSRKVMEGWERREGDEEAWLGIWGRMMHLVDGLAELGARVIPLDFGGTDQSVLGLSAP